MLNFVQHLIESCERIGFAVWFRRLALTFGFAVWLRRTQELGYPWLDARLASAIKKEVNGH